MQFPLYIEFDQIKEKKEGFVHFDQTDQNNFTLKKTENIKEISNDNHLLERVHNIISQPSQSEKMIPNLIGKICSSKISENVSENARNALFWISCHALNKFEIYFSQKHEKNKKDEKIEKWHQLKISLLDKITELYNKYFSGNKSIQKLMLIPIISLIENEWNLKVKKKKKKKKILHNNKKKKK